MPRWTILILIIGVAIACYVISWPLSFFVAYSYYTDNTYRQIAPATIQDVKIEVWLNTVNTTWYRSWLCPLVISGESKGPYTIVVRLDDPDMEAKSYRINSAQLTKADGMIVDLNLATQHPGSDVQRWRRFFKNASAWIGHVYHNEDLELDGPVNVQLDLAVEKEGKKHRETIDIQMVPTVNRREGLAIR